LAGEGDGSVPTKMTTFRRWPDAIPPMPMTTLPPPLACPPGVVLDRRDHDAKHAPPIDRISQSAAFLYVVLLSEPGIGKSAAK